MNRVIAWAAAALLAWPASWACATTWAPGEVTDPIAKAKITVDQPMSSGSYIYQWPGKADQVFWPYTTDQWLWFNAKSGYIAFGNDFEKPTPDEVAALTPWLKANYDPKAPPSSRPERLAWAEKVYAARGVGDDFWCFFYRLMAFETAADASISLGYVKKALPLLQDRLAKATKPGQKLESLYLVGEYQRRIGNEAEAARLLDELKAAEVTAELTSFKKYLLDIATEQRAPQPKP